MIFNFQHGLLSSCVARTRTCPFACVSLHARQHLSLTLAGSRYEELHPVFSFYYCPSSAPPGKVHRVSRQIVPRLLIVLPHCCPAGRQITIYNKLHLSALTYNGIRSMCLRVFSPMPPLSPWPCMKINIYRYISIIHSVAESPCSYCPSPECTADLPDHQALHILQRHERGALISQRHFLRVCPPSPSVCTAIL